MNRRGFIRLLGLAAPAAVVAPAAASALTTAAASSGELIVTGGIVATRINAANIYPGSISIGTLSAKDMLLGSVPSHRILGGPAGENNTQANEGD